MYNTPPVAHCMSVYSAQGIENDVPTGFQTKVRPPLTLTFDLLTPEVDSPCPCLRRRFRPVCIKTGSFVFEVAFSVHKLATDERTNKRTDKRTKRQVDNIMPPASLDWRTEHTVYLYCRYCVRSCVFIMLSAFSRR